MEDKEDNAESTEEKQTEHQYGSSKLSSDKPNSKITLPTTRLCTTPTSRDLPKCLSNTLLTAHQHTSFLTFQLSYIRYMEGIEALGQG